ncbi:MAG: MBL fold metallo-hydrolase [Clostridiaceae bacterium]
MSEIRIKTLVVGMVGTNCYLVYDHETKKSCRRGPGRQRRQDRQYGSISGFKAGGDPLTHGHFDHMMAAKKLKEAWHVPIYACEKEIEVLSDSRNSLVASYYREPYTLTPDITVKEGDELSIAGFTWKVFETPGHTIGSCCYYIEKESVLFSGDTLFAGSYGRTDFPTGSGRQIAESVRRLLSTLPDDTMVYPGHMDTTTIGFEKKYNPLSGAMG